MTLAGNSLSFDDMRKACKRYADEFLRDPDARGSHTVYVPQAKEASATAEEQEGDTDVETALAALAEESDRFIMMAIAARRILSGRIRAHRHDRSKRRSSAMD